MFLIVLVLFACTEQDEREGEVKDDDNPPSAEADPYNPLIEDDYSKYANLGFAFLWGSYNLHDPTIIKHDSTYYIFSTDVAYGPNLKCGIMQRKSDDLVHWDFRGWVFNGIPAIPLEFMESNQPGYQQLSIWAPYILEVDGEYRLYYSIPGNNGLKLACIALATATHPEGPWTDKGIVLYCLPDDDYNAIDPAVTVDQKTGKHWMVYGSYSAGIFMVELNPVTGKLLTEEDRGKRIAFREHVHDAIEGAEILYNPALEKYFMFVSYDWLEDQYNVRVGRSDSPEGPFLDYNGKELAQVGDNIPMITAQYQFDHHPGWQGVGHCGLLRDGDEYYFVSQGRLGSNKYLMNLHVRKMVFSSDGWPLVSPERYASIPQEPHSIDSLTGKWEQIELLTTANKNTSLTLTLAGDGSIDEYPAGSWTLNNSILTIALGTDKVIEARIFNEWDWEREVRTIVFTGMTSEGICVWGKKIK